MAPEEATRVVGWPYRILSKRSQPTTPAQVAATVGLLIAFVQAATQLQEQTFQYAAKFFAIVVVILITASLLGGTLVHYSDRIFSGFAGMVRS